MERKRFIPEKQGTKATDFGVRVKYPDGLVVYYKPTPEQREKIYELLDEGKQLHEAFSEVMKAGDDKKREH